MGNGIYDRIELIEKQIEMKIKQKFVVPGREIEFRKYPSVQATTVNRMRNQHH